MIGEVQMHGAELCQERVDMVLGQPSGVYSADQIFTPAPAPDHCLHDELKGVWWLLQCFPQQFYNKENDRIQWRVPYGTPRHLPDGAVIHESAVRRLTTTVSREAAYVPCNLKKDHLQPLPQGAGLTTANLNGCEEFRTQPGLLPPQDSMAVRWGKLVAGWLTFGLFIALVAAVVWYLLALLWYLVLWLVWCLLHTPGIALLYG